MKHGLSNHKYYNTWRSMMGRCYNPSHHKYHRYGKRGITVCEEWKKIEKFLNWVESQYPIPEGFTLDRIDNNKEYSPTNCRFASMVMQRSNREHPIFYNGENLTFKSLVEKYGVVAYSTAKHRLRRGMTPVDAALTPFQQGKRIP